MKQVEYQGKEYSAPDWANYVCADGDGQVWCYEYEPTWSDYRERYEESAGRARNLTELAAIPPVKRI